MQSYCPYCDPKHFTIHGFCKNCRRRCDAPLYDRKSGMTPEEYAEYKKNWDSNRSDLVLDAMRRQD